MSAWSVERRHPRYQIQLPLRHFTAAPAPSRAGVGWTRDVSEGGACVELAERLLPRTPLRLFLRTDRKGVELEAEVVWAGPRKGRGEGILHGVAFTRVLPEQLLALRELIRTKGQVRNTGVRVPLEIPVTCCPATRKGPSLEGMTGDIGRGGLLLLLPEVIAPGSTLEVTLHTPHGPLAVEGTVVWVEAPGGWALGPPIRHGFRFSGLGWSSSLSLDQVLAEAA